MQITIPNPIFETQLFILIFLGLILTTLQSRKNNDAVFPPPLTQELKGMAILTIIFGHIGYFLAKNTEFLFPLSVASGVGVNIFLLLSGYGLTVSHLKKPLPILQFYQKRLLRLFIPLWIVLTIFFFAYYFILGLTFPTREIIENFLGFYPKAHILYSPNSPLWYITPILFYYFIFPLATYKKLKYISPIIIYLLTYYLVQYKLPINEDVQKLYQLHYIAFPLGMSFALIPDIFRNNSVYKKLHSLILHRGLLVSLLAVIIFGFTFCYYALNSGVGESKTIEQNLSIITTLAAVAFFIVKKFESNFLLIIGEYSYEIYLIHWPLLLNFDLLYKALPPFLATFAYLFLFIGLGIILQKFSNKIANVLHG